MFNLFQGMLVFICLTCLSLASLLCFTFCFRQTSNPTNCNPKSQALLVLLEVISQCNHGVVKRVNQYQVHIFYNIMNSFANFPMLFTHSGT